MTDSTTGQQNDHGMTTAKAKKGTFLAWVRRIVFYILLFPLILLCISWIWLIFFPPNLAPYIPTLSQHLAHWTGLDFHLATLTVRPGLSLVLEGKEIHVATLTSHESVLDAEAIRLRFSPLQWIRGWPALSLSFQGPKLALRRNGNGEIILGNFNLTNLQGRHDRPHSSAMVSSVPLPIQHIALDQAELSWNDDRSGVAQEDRIPIVIKHTNLSVFFEPAGVIRINLEGMIAEAKGQSSLKWSGIRSPDGVWAGTLAADQVFLPSLSLYLGRSPTVNHFSSPVDVRMDYSWETLHKKGQCHWTVQTGTTNLNLPSLFRWPLPIDSLVANGSVVVTDGVLDVKGVSFKVTNVDGEAQGVLDLTGLGSQKPWIDLATTVRGIPTDRANTYYPAHIMHSGLVTWLEKALHSGHVGEAKLRIKGPLHEIPFATPPEKGETETIFSINADVQQVNFTFHQGLPDLTRGQAIVTVDRLGITIQIPHATFGKSQDVRGLVRIADMVHHPIVEVEAHIPKADLASIWKDVVANPTLHWDRAAGLGGMKIVGRGVANLSLLLPIQNIEQSWFGGTLDFEEVSLQPPYLEVPLEHAKGRLVLDPHRVTLEIRSGMLNNKPVSLSSEGLFYREPGKANLQGRVDTVFTEKDLEPWFAPLLGSDGSIQGTAPLTVRFQRRGIAGKFDVSSLFNANNLAIHGGLGWSKAGGTPGMITVTGKGDLEGKLELSALQWDLGNLSFVGDGLWHLKRGVGQLKISRFRLDDNRGQLHIVQTSPSGLGNWKIVAQMDWLNLAPVLAKEEPTPDIPTEKVKRVISWPRVDIHLGAHDFGLANMVKGDQLDSRLTIENNRVTLHHLRGKLNGTDHTMRGTLQWLAMMGSGPYVGQFHMESYDAGLLFHGIDVQSALMRGGHATLDVALDGFLPPRTRLKHHLSGTANFDATDGTIARLGILSQVLGVFSLKELPNLVVLDRPDLIANGFRYDRIKSKMVLKRSVAKLDEFSVDGPSMKMVLSGNIDFPRKKLDLLLGIRPIQTLDKIISSVPLLGTLVAGHREAFLETVFDIGGTLDDPKVTIRPVASIIPGIVRDMLTKPDDSTEQSEP
ncbi:MAG: AsmA-like C-terminal domain-containing protein [Nitrospirae bacterium]|nr:AsmA-like C-terminal domain-containing protein [Magnetococcales bacterium]HAT51529.1 hypothetical protein [Alphaproteobacteria bacterium]